MTEKDEVFRLIPAGEYANPNTFCHYGWEGIGAFALWKYATAYYDSAEILFEKFKTSAGHNDILDGTGITMCFLYRHFVELSIKHLYVKFVCTSKEDYKKFLEHGHRLLPLWNATKPKLKELRDRVGSTVSLVVLEHYINEFDKFDRDGTTMRYPMKNNLEPTKEPARLDIINLHERVNELYWAFDGIVNDLENQMQDEVEEQKIEDFLNWYERLRPRMLWLIESLAPLTKAEDKGPRWLTMTDIMVEDPRWVQQRELMLSCADDELMMADCLYYTGRSIVGRQLNLPKNPLEAKVDAVKMCVENMEYDHFEFGKPKNDNVSIDSKAASAILRCMPLAMRVIDWDKPDVLEKLSEKKRINQE